MFFGYHTKLEAFQVFGDILTLYPIEKKSINCATASAQIDSKISLIPRILNKLFRYINKKFKLNWTVTSIGVKKYCEGSIDGKNFLYSDGSQDLGKSTTLCYCKIGNHTIAWEEKN